MYLHKKPVEIFKKTDGIGEDRQKLLRSTKIGTFGKKTADLDLKIQHCSR